MPPMSDSSWAVTTWNVHGSTRPPIDALAGALAAQSPDVVAVQEIRSGQARALARALGMGRHWSAKHFPFTRLAFWTAEGLAILSPHDITSTGSTELTLGASRRTYLRRIAQWADIEREDGSLLRVYNVHLSSGDAQFERRAEAARLARLVESHRCEHQVVVAGDLNDDTDLEVIAAMPGVEHLTPPPTNPSEQPTQTLDHVLLPADARAVALSIPAGGDEWADLSDHLPLTVRFALA